MKDDHDAKSRCTGPARGDGITCVPADDKGPNEESRRGKPPGPQRVLRCWAWRLAVCRPATALPHVNCGDRQLGAQTGPQRLEAGCNYRAGICAGPARRLRNLGDEARDRTAAHQQFRQVGIEGAGGCRPAPPLMRIGEASARALGVAGFRRLDVPSLGAHMDEATADQDGPRRVDNDPSQVGEAATSPRSDRRCS